MMRWEPILSQVKVNVHKHYEVVTQTHIMWVYSNSLHIVLLFIIGCVNSKGHILSSRLLVLSNWIWDTIRYKPVQFESKAISLNIIFAGKMKREDHAVWGNCSAKWLFPSHWQAASLHINGRPGYLSGTHINLCASRLRARRRVAVVLLLPVRNVSPQAFSLCGA